MPSQDYYGILGVSQDASTQDIKKAFRKIARECHPDVAGDDPVLAERFKVARTAYETLMDPMTRGRYDRRGQRRGGMGAGAGGSFFDAFYRGTERRDSRSGPSYGTSAAGGHASTKGARHNPENHLDLDDLFNDFGDFGFGNADRRRTRSTTGRESAGPPPPNRDPVPGEDVEVDLDVPAGVAARGGSVTAVYYRQQRADSWRPGSPDPGLVRVQDIADVRIVPGTTTGATFRERGLGNAGANGGPYGDLIVRVNVVGRVRSERRARPESKSEASSSDVVDVSVAEAILGGRIELPTPQGVVRITIPAGTSSGMRLRLKGKGAKGPDGKPEDLYVRVRIVVPRQLDDESRALIEEFARLNPGSPRD